MAMVRKIPPDFRDLCHYVVPHNSPLNTNGPFVQRNCWQLYTSRHKIPTHNLILAEQHISSFFVEHYIPYLFHKGAGIFYASLKWRQVLDLRDQFECDVERKLKPDLASLLARLGP